VVLAGGGDVSGHLQDPDDEIAQDDLGLLFGEQSPAGGSSLECGCGSKG
jgi:hypothetical protein